MSAPVWALGAMSGTSMDGIDAAMIRTDGIDVFDFGPTRYLPYSVADRELIREGQGK